MCHLSGWLSRKENMSYMTLFVCDHKNLGIPMCLWSRLFSPLLSFLFINIMISQHHAEHRSWYVITASGWYMYSPFDS